jgi:DNA-binding GntR family transcriptional regulator
MAREGAQPMNEVLAAEGAVGNRPSLVDGAESALRNWLAPGRYRQGDRLPPEHEVAAMLGVSRGTLRSALQRLERSGEIVRRQGSGTFVGRMGFPTAFGERLERLEPYSSVAARRGLTLAAVDLEIELRAVDQEACEALELPPGAHTTAISRTLMAEGTPVAVMYDVVHPEIALPALERLQSSLAGGQMVLDVMIEIGVPITFARTRVLPALVSGRESSGKRLGISGTTACLELEELIFASRDVPVAYSRDLFAPGGIDVMVMRSLDAPKPARIGGERGEAGSRPSARPPDRSADAVERARRPRRRKRQ